MTGASFAADGPAGAFDRARHCKCFGKLQFLHSDAFFVHEVCGDATTAEMLPGNITFRAETHAHTADVCFESAQIVMQHVTNTLCSVFADGVDDDFHGDRSTGCQKLCDVREEIVILFGIIELCLSLQHPVIDFSIRILQKIRTKARFLSPSHTSKFSMSD